MKAALILCPFFTNGDYPSLGISSINGALLDAGHETSCFDLCWLGYKEAGGEYHLIRQFFGVGIVEDEVVFVLGPELGLYLLFREEDSGYKLELNAGPEIRQAAAMLYLGLRRMAPGWADMILDSSPEAVFFSTYASNVFVSLYLAKHIRQREPGLPIIFGGPGSSLPEMQDFILETGFVDAVIAGEGELTVKELCSDFKRSMAEGIPGLAVSGRGAVDFTPRPLVKDLDSLPDIRHDGLPGPGLDYEAYQSNRPNRYLTPFFEGLPLASTRGCVNRCAYCSESAYWARFRQRRPDKVVEQLERLKSRLGETRFLFSESAFNGNPGWLRSFCDTAGSLDFKPVFSSLLIGDRRVDESLAQAMYNAGFRYAVLGVETFSASIRERMNKRASEQEIFSSILALSRAGINVKVNLLVGFPGETEQEFEASIRNMEKWAALGQDERGQGRVHWDVGHTVRIEAYSALYNDPERYGIKLTPIKHSLPEKYSRLEKPLSRISYRWTMDLDRDTVKNRSARMKEVAINIMK